MKLANILERKNYSERVKQLSQAFRDQPKKPLDRAIWWIEWTLRNPRPDYLKSPTLRIGHFVGNSFDVISFLIISPFLLFIFLKFFFRIVRKFASSEYNDGKKKVD